MSSNGSRRRDRPPDDELVLAELERPEELDSPPLDPLSVEYLVELDPPEAPWRISVPKSTQSSQTWSSAPSIFAVRGDAVSAPHISHWTMADLDRARP
jgi:hypothetical protein